MGACHLEIWFADEARVGQKNKITRRWARRGTRPSAPHDQRTAYTTIFGAICPEEGKSAALVLPHCNTEAMNLHLAGVAAAAAPGAYAVLLLDQAGWHLSDKVAVPPNITLAPLPLRRLEQAHQPTLAHHVHRIARLGIQVMILETWYKVFWAPRFFRHFQENWHTRNFFCDLLEASCPTTLCRTSSLLLV